ncbi:protein kinase [Phytophthora infestans T30-4]|uniref:Protein kinase n=1 Tax=Phytophthora infestans (strain T30-4) TaxID=403677 RepID=D0P2W4_PHYIT|nr:protein kinase [Phytophthora infestans T30-4]EEY57103.1 protein kinase [Phytophthora infestans T30-4]|eukprot:XP_002895361.1 protein kinase [Phytophthora infestans T30-4]
MSDVDSFVKEVKLASTMSHPNIVQLIGVAWDYREDFCCVMEYMDGGDLRGLMDKYEDENRRTGFDAAKITIALHVAHALAYLHSRDVPVIHRDLKSENILLNEALGAKLTDFGVSRERVDRAMTADVGTSLWMAPEVMIGNAYDEKADMFRLEWYFPSCQCIRYHTRM